MDLEGIKEFAKDEEKYRMAVLAALTDLNKSLERATRLLELSVAASSRNLFGDIRVDGDGLRSALTEIRRVAPRSR